MAGSIRQQVEYYLSAGNLRRDAFLCSIMDPDGWMALERIATFNCMKRLGATAESAAEALLSSREVEVSQDRRRVRPRDSGLRQACVRAGRTGPLRLAAAGRGRQPLADMGLPAPAADSSPPRRANAQAVILERSAAEGVRVLVQLRSWRMPVMPGHLATVGGCCDRTDPDSRFTALREVVEETGLSAGLMYPPVKFAEGQKVDWFAMQLRGPEFRGRQDLPELDDIRSVLAMLPPSTCPAECFGHAWVRVCELDGLGRALPLMGGMLWKIQQAVGHLRLDVDPPSGCAATTTEEVVDISSDSGIEEGGEAAMQP